MAGAAGAEDLRRRMGVSAFPAARSHLPAYLVPLTGCDSSTPQFTLSTCRAASSRRRGHTEAHVAEGTDVRTVADFHDAVRALCEYFKTDTTIIIGSQAILVGWPDAPAIM